MTDSSGLAEIERLIAVFYAQFDNREGRRPSLQALQALFAAHAIIVRDGGNGICETLSVTAFAEPRIALLTGGELTGFHEWETGSDTSLAGAVASRSSTYGKAGTLHGAAYAGGGRKFFQLGRFADGWRITAVAWSDDS